jgi:dTDP-4-amino-4,6-dideoxygalactose transaminase
LKITTTGLTIPFTGLKKQYNNLRTEILDVTDEVLRSGVLMGGNYTAEFENWLARKNHVSYAVTCHSGTQALEILASYYLNPVAEELSHVLSPTVLVPALTYPATANAFLRAGWQVIIGDTDYYGQIDVRKTINDMDTHYHAVCAVGLYGAALGDMQIFRNRAILIEDAAQHWLSDGCKRQGDSTAISFDPTKNLANYGNGGAIVSGDRNLLDYARNWVNNGKHTRHAETGSNSRMSETDCAQMMVKTRHIDGWQKRRAKIAGHWIERLKNTGIRTLIDDTNFATHCYHKFVIELDARDTVQRNLAIRKIETKVHYAEPLHELPAYKNLKSPDLLSPASALSRRCLSLPIYPELSDLEVEYIMDQLLALV